MKFPSSNWILFLTAFLAAAKAASAAPAADALRFGELFRQEVQALKPGVDPARLTQLHFGPDVATQNALEARGLGEALEALKGGSLASLQAAQRAAPRTELALPSVRGRQLTVVLVPGVFAEFIKNRAFEDVLEKPSSFRTEFEKRVAAARAGGVAAATDLVQPLKKFEPGKSAEETGVPTALSELVQAGELDVHGAKVRVILLATPFGSLESLGDATVRAEMFNRRLEKYLALTGENQDLAFVGYSRGTVLGLEMLARAHREGKPWLANVKAMISLSGVVLGSTLADDATRGAASPTRKLLQGLRDTGASLEKYPEGMGVLDRTRLRARNDARWAKFLADAAPLVKEMSHGNPLDEIMSVTKVDPRAPVGIMVRMWTEIGLNSFWGDYNRNIDRFNRFVNELLASVSELSSESRVRWFRSHELPRHVTYYGITAAMANPEANATEKDLFANPLAYGSGSYDDKMLTQNRKDYEQLSGGLALNDSQVSVVQAAFPAGVLESLSPKHAGLRTKFLGVCGTHHWGMALREVNKMFGGQVNGFPREALLRALSMQVLIDSSGR